MSKMSKTAQAIEIRNFRNADYRWLFGSYFDIEVSKEGINTKYKKQNQTKYRM